MKKLLFVGNSFTYYHDLPAMLLRRRLFHPDRRRHQGRLVSGALCRSR